MGLLANMQTLLKECKPSERMQAHFPTSTRLAKLHPLAPSAGSMPRSTVPHPSASKQPPSQPQQDRLEQVVGDLSSTRQLRRRACLLALLSCTGILIPIQSAKEATAKNSDDVLMKAFLDAFSAPDFEVCAPRGMYIEMEPTHIICHKSVFLGLHWFPRLKMLLGARPSK